MQRRYFQELFPSVLFDNKRVLVDEVLPQACDFFLMDLVRVFNYSIFTYYTDKASMLNVFGSRNVTGMVESIYSTEERDADVLDGMWTRNELFPCLNKGFIHVFRSNTTRTSMYYEYDLVIRIEPLRSGCSDKLDGVIRVFNRNITHVVAKYKIRTEEVEYFTEDA